MSEKIVDEVRQRVGCYDGLDITPAQVRCVIKHFSIVKKEAVAPMLRGVPAVDQVGELLAVIHGDGGHYQAEHGRQKAALDAVAKVYALMQAIAEREQSPAVDHARVPIVVETVGFVRRNEVGDLFIGWTIEGSLAALEVGDELLVASESVTNDDGYGEVYTASPAPGES